MIKPELPKTLARELDKLAELLRLFAAYRATYPLNTTQLSAIWGDIRRQNNVVHGVWTELQALEDE